MSTSFRARLRDASPLRGTFVKLPAPQAVEILGNAGFDFVVIDAEHAPLDRRDIDLAVLAARAAGIAAVVRVSDRGTILSALDSGADGIMVPHVGSFEAAQAAVSASRYRTGARGFSASGRAGGYGGRSMSQHVRSQDESIAVIAMVEEPAGVRAAAAIAGVDGIDAVFVGRGDLAVTLGADSDSAPEVQSAVQQVSAATRAAGKCLWLMAADRQEAMAFRALGASGFLLHSDQALLRRAATAALRELDELDPVR